MSEPLKLVEILKMSFTSSDSQANQSSLSIHIKMENTFDAIATNSSKEDFHQITERYLKEYFSADKVLVFDNISSIKILYCPSTGSYFPHGNGILSFAQSSSQILCIKKASSHNSYLYDTDKSILLSDQQALIIPLIDIQSTVKNIILIIKLQNSNPFSDDDVISAEYFQRKFKIYYHILFSVKFEANFILDMFKISQNDQRMQMISTKLTDYFDCQISEFWQFNSEKNQFAVYSIKEDMFISQSNVDLIRPVFEQKEPFLSFSIEKTGQSFLGAQVRYESGPFFYSIVLKNKRSSNFFNEIEGNKLLQILPYVTFYLSSIETYNIQFDKLFNEYILSFNCDIIDISFSKDFELFSINELENDKIKHIYFDEDKFKILANIQENLYKLHENSDDKDIDNIMNQIPCEFLSNKDDLMIICELFAFFAINKNLQITKNVLKLFDRLLPTIKDKLQDESSFFWKIFKGFMPFTFWFYEEGLISIEYIISKAIRNHKSNITEIFLPEILEKSPEIFYEDLIFNYKLPYSDDYINEFKERRKLFLKWIRESGNFNDDIYAKIETDPIRLAIKRDDLATFINLLKDKNISVDSNYRELSFENKDFEFYEENLLNFSIKSNSIKIFKYLFGNTITFNSINFEEAIKNRNQEIIEIIEPQFREIIFNQHKDILIFIFSVFQSEGLNGYLETYFPNELKILTIDEPISPDQYGILFKLIDCSFSNSNYSLFNSMILPFLKKNLLFVNEYIYELLISSVNQQSCFFMKEILKFSIKSININYYDLSYNTLLGKSIMNENAKAVDILLQYPDLNVNNKIYDNYFTFFSIASIRLLDMKIVKLICNHPNFDINKCYLNDQSDILLNSIEYGNIYLFQYIIDNFSKTFVLSLSDISSFPKTINNNHLYSLKLYLKYFLDINRIDGDRFLHDMDQKLLNEENLDKYLNIVKKILIELGYPCSSIDEVRKYYVIPNMFLEHIDQSLNMTLTENCQLQLELVYNEENINNENESSNNVDEDKSLYDTVKECLGGVESESSSDDKDKSLYDTVIECLGGGESESSSDDKDKSLYDTVIECLGGGESESSSDDKDKSLYDIVKECLGDVGFSSDSD